MKGLGIVAVVFCAFSTVALWSVFLTDFLPSPRSVAITAYTACAVAWGIIAYEAMK